MRQEGASIARDPRGAARRVSRRSACGSATSRLDRGASTSARRQPIRLSTDARSASARGVARAGRSAATLRSTAARSPAAEIRCHCAGCMLYWGEGSKARNGVAFTNADVDMLVFFRRFLRESYGVEDEARVASGSTATSATVCRWSRSRTWWLTALALPRASLRASTVNRASRASKRRAATADPRHRRTASGLDLDRPEHLRGDPGVRRLHPRGVARPRAPALGHADGEPAVDQQRGARDVAGLVRAEERRGGAHVGDVAEPARGDRLAGGLLGGLA